MKKRILISLLSVIVLTLMVASVFVFAQVGGTRQNGKPTLRDRFHGLIRAKEPKIKKNSSRFKMRRDKNGADFWNGSDEWSLGKHWVSVDYIELAQLEYAKGRVQGFLFRKTADSFRPAQTKLTNLGNEAYMEVRSVDPFKKSKVKKAVVIVRVGKVVIDVQASKPKLALRFARYYADAVTKRNKEEGLNTKEKDGVKQKIK